MKIWAVVVALLAIVGCSQPPAKVGAVDTFAVVVSVNPDGSADAQETVTIAPDEGRIVFHRAVVLPASDGVAFESASIDGAPIEPGSNGLVLEPRTSGFAVTWTGEGRTSPVAFALHYRATAAVAAREPRGRLEWPVFQPAHGFAVGAASVTLQLPEGARTYDGTGMGEVGWSVELTPRGVSARRSAVADEEAATLLAVFDIDHARIAEPRWELNRDRAQQYFLALISAGLFILVVGAGVLAQLRVQYPPVRADASADVRAAAQATRRSLSRGLFLSAAASLVLAVVCAGLAFRFLAGLGQAVYAIPASIALVSVWFLIAAWWYRRTTRVA